MAILVPEAKVQNAVLVANDKPVVGGNQVLNASGVGTALPKIVVNGSGIQFIVDRFVIAANGKRIQLYY